MVVRRTLPTGLPTRHFFNAGARVKRFTPAGPDHARVAASAGMADYVDALYAHHFSDNADPRRARAVTAMKRVHEDGRLKPLLDFLGNRNDVRILGSGRIGTETGGCRPWRSIPPDLPLRLPTRLLDMASWRR